MPCESSIFKRFIVLLAVISLQPSWAEDVSSAGSGIIKASMFNSLIDQFKASNRGAQLSIPQVVGEWTCEFKVEDRDVDFPSLGVEKTENYDLTFVEKITKKPPAPVDQANQGLALEAEVVRHVDKKNPGQIEIRMGGRQVISGQASSRGLHEMAHDVDLDTVDEIALTYNGSMRTLLIERSYFYKGPYKAFSLESKDSGEWFRRYGGNTSAKLRVPRAFSICIPAI